MFNVLKYGIIAGLIFAANYINEGKDYVISYAEVIQDNDTMLLETTVTIEEWENAVQRYITDSIANSLENNAVE